MDVTKLILNLQSTLTNSTLDQQMISKAIKLLQLGAVEYVSSYASLPSPGGVNGLLYLAGADGLYFSINNGWLPITTTTQSYLWGWGDPSGTVGVVGDGFAIARSSPVSVIGGFTDWNWVGAGYRHSTGVRSNGTLWTWGFNLAGQLGDCTTTTKSSPISVVGGFTDWKQSTAGANHTIALRSNGTLWGWGANQFGQIGDNTITSKSSPVSVIGGFTDWCCISTSNNHNLAVRTNGTLWSWGSNTCGTLGNNGVNDAASPISVVGGFTDWCQVSAGYRHSLAVRSNGTIWAWGNNPSGELGDNSQTPKTSPVSVVGGFTDWCQASASRCGNFSLGLRTNGSLWAWGGNNCSQLGDNTTVNKSSPISVVGGFTDWCQISAGACAGFGLRTNGTIWAWGKNLSGQIGDNTTVDKSSPVSIVGGFTNWSQISAGGCAFIHAIRKLTL